MSRELVVVLDFGGQYKQLIARRVRECSVYCEIHPYTMSLEKLKALSPKGIILTGGPNSVYKSDSPTYDKAIFELGIPVLGICYGSQLMAYKLGGKVATAPVSEYGHTDVTIDKTSSVLFSDVAPKTMQFSSIPKLSIHRKARRCSAISSSMSADAAATGRWNPSSMKP